MLAYKNNNFIINLIIINLLIFLIFPFNIANFDGYSYDQNTFLSILIISITSSIICIALLFIIKKTLSKLNQNISFYIEIFIKFTLFWVFITGIFFPVTGDHDPFLNVSLSIGKKYEILLKFVLASIIFYIFEKNNLTNLIFRFIIIYVIINLFFVVSQINFNFNDKHLINTKINKFGKKNLIVLSFDGISGIKMFDEVEDNQELRENLKDFIFFKNVTTALPYTYGSINAEINGNYNDNPSDAKLNNILNDNNLDVSVYSSYEYMVSDKKNTLSKGGYKNYSNSFELNKFMHKYFIGSIGRWATYLSISAVKPIFYLQLYKKFINLIDFDSEDKINPYEIIATPFYIDLFEYDLIFEEIAFDANLKNTVRMYHFPFSHWPVKVNENCEEVRSLNNINSYEHESVVIKCISKKIIKFLKLIKKNKIYDNSMIVIKSDHGKPNFLQLSYSTNFFQLFNKKKLDKYYDSYPHNLTINESFYWGYGRYKPFIMVKNIDVNNKEIKISEKHTFIHDLSATYCNFYYDENYCMRYKRNNLVIDDNLFKEYNYDIYLPKNKYTFQGVAKFNKHLIPNSSSLIDFLNQNEINIK